MRDEKLHNKWYENAEWKALAEDHYLPTICIDLRMAINGGADAWSDEKIKAVTGYLKARLEDWHPSIDHNQTFDDAVRMMCWEVLRLVEEDKKERLLREIENERIKKLAYEHEVAMDRAVWAINNDKLELILLLGRTVDQVSKLPEELKRDIEKLFRRLEKHARRCKRCGYVSGTIPHPKYCGPADPTTGEAASHDYEAVT